VTKHKVLLVPFPFDDLSGSKLRPAVCLTNPVGPHKHVVLAFITSRIAADPQDTDVILDDASPDFPTTGLRFSSTLHLHRLMTVTTSVIQRELGELPPGLQAEVAAKLRVLFELP